ncbi:MAG: EamA family transporter [Actinomycetota bacterium]|nr:EamA family transporter [Actinomycetota bacterium]
MDHVHRIGATAGPAVPAPAYFMVGAVAQYAGAAIAVVLFERMSAPGVALVRVASAGAILTVAYRFPWRGWDRRRWLVVAGFGAALALMNLLYYLAIDRLPLGTATAIEFTGPVAVAAASARSARSVASVALAAGGVLVLADVQWEASAAGVVFALGAAAMWAGYILLGHRVAHDGLGVRGLAVSMLVGSLVIAPFGAGSAVAAFASPELLAVCVLVGLLSNVVPYVLDQIVLRQLSEGAFALLLALLPATAAVVGAVALRQHPTVTEIVGIVCVTVAVAVRPR